MTRYLSLALGAKQPLFGQSIQELERASGRPSADIRLSSEMMQRVRAKVIQLGLDPQDTTGAELYSALLGRLKQDEANVRRALNIAGDASALDVLSRIEKFLNSHKAASASFVMKPAVAKRLLKKKIPKNAMRRLGYRSFDSMLKHESVAAIYAAAAISESASWHKQLREQYNKLQASDFEQRKISVISLTSKRWKEASAEYVQTARHNMFCFKELGTVVLLPLENQIDGLAITSLLLALHYMNDVRSFSSFAKLQQVKPTFGQAVRQASVVDPLTSANLAGQPVSWKVIQRYYGRLKNDLHPEVFEPHVQPEDLEWHEAEEVLVELEPSLGFWLDTQYSCLLDNDQPVSLNILDVALAYCNHLGFADRIVHFAREHLWQELMSRYLHQENLEAAVRQQLSKELVEDIPLAE